MHFNNPTPLRGVLPSLSASLSLSSIWLSLPLSLHTQLRQYIAFIKDHGSPKPDLGMKKWKCLFTHRLLCTVFFEIIQLSFNKFFRPKGSRNWLCAFIKEKIRCSQFKWFFPRQQWCTFPHNSHFLSSLLDNQGRFACQLLQAEQQACRTGKQ